MVMRTNLRANAGAAKQYTGETDKLPVETAGEDQWVLSLASGE